MNWKCLFGHAWFYYDVFETQRVCLRCGKHQRHYGGLLPWA